MTNAWRRFQRDLSGGKPGDARFSKFCKKYNNPYLNYLPYLYEKKSFRLSTYADGIYKYPRENPLGHYLKNEQIAFIESPVDQSILWEIRAPCDGTLIDVDDSWWACKDGILGDFQPDLEQNVFDLKYQGYIGFSINNELGNNFLILHYLERNKLASNKNFYHKFINRTDVTIYVGDIGIHNNVKELSDLKYCNLSSQPKEATLWYCPFDYVSTGDKIITQLDSTNNKINFHTTWKDMLIPSSVGNSLFFLYINSSKGKCHIINDNRIGIDNQGDYI